MCVTAVFCSVVWLGEKLICKELMDDVSIDYLMHTQTPLSTFSFACLLPHLFEKILACLMRLNATRKKTDNAN
jgi:hypothetical protein